jgi:tetratricopeptide (TPR) repeat protein
MFQKTFSDRFQEIEDDFNRGNFQSTGPASEQLAREFPQQPLAHFLVAKINAALARDAQLALKHIDQAIFLDPLNVVFKLVRAKILLDLSFYHIAIPLLKQCAAAAPQLSQARSALGEAYFKIGLGAEAVDELRAAIKLEKEGTDEKSSLRNLLANCLLRSNKMAEARLVLDKVLQENDDHFCSALSLRILAADKSELPKLKLLVDRKLNSANLTLENKEKLHLSTGHIFDRQGDHDAAFLEWQISRNTIPREEISNKDHQLEQRLRSDMFSTELFDLTNDHASASEIPIVVVGMPRTGTTLCEQILASHPLVSTAGELGLWDKYELGYLNAFAGKPISEATEHARVGGLKATGEELLRTLKFNAKSGSVRIVEKTPHNFLALGFLHLVFPNAKFIFMDRNPLDSFVSTYQNEFTRWHGYAYDQIGYAKEYLWHKQIIEMWKGRFPKNIMTIKYEKLVESPEEMARSLLDFVGLPWDENVLKFYERETTVRTFSSQQVRNPVNNSSVGRWKRYASHLQPLIAALGGEGSYSKS